MGIRAVLRFGIDIIISLIKPKIYTPGQNIVRDLLLPDHRTSSRRISIVGKITMDKQQPGELTETAVRDQEDVRYKKIGDTTYEVVYNYVGKNSLLDVVKGAIKREVEGGL